MRDGVEVKLLPQQGELYVFAQSRDRVTKERAMRRRQLRALWARLQKLQAMKLEARPLLLKLGEARGQYRAAWRLLDFELPAAGGEGAAAFTFRLNRRKLRIACRREGRYPFGFAQGRGSCAPTSPDATPPNSGSFTCG